MKKLLGVGVLCTLLLLAACGGDDTAEPVVVATEAATPTTEAVVEATPTTAVSETESLTETEGMTDTESMTGTEEMDDNQALTDTEAMTGTTVVTGAGALTETMEMTGTESMTESAGIEEAPRQLIRATDLQGYNVENAAGESLGSVQDVVMNLADGQILLVTVEYGGFLDIGDKVFPIPLSAFRFERDTDALAEPPLGSDVALTDTLGMTDTVGLTDAVGMTDATGLSDPTPFFGDTILILDIPEETFQNAPGIDENLDLTDPTGIGGIETFYRDLGEDVIGRPIAETDLESLTGNAVKLSDIQGSNVQNPAGEGVGEVNDMLIDLRAGRVEYFILEFGGFLGIGDNEYAIPVDAFDVIPTSADVADGFPTLVLDVTEEQLETAPVFDADTLGNPDWDLDSRDFWLPNGN